MSGVEVELRTVTRQWEGRGGVANVSISVSAGSFVSILGPSGCGKSTLLRIVAGLERPSAGSVLIGARDVTHLPASARGLSMVFQSYALFPHLSVRENIQFGMRVRRVPRAERETRLADVTAMMGLEGFEDRKPAALSGGQRQRVALARAVVSGHPLCLMDEPLSNLDAKLRHAVRRDIKALQWRLGLTVIYVTHDQGEAMSLSDHVVLMQSGRVVQAAPPEVLYDRPATIFAAEFIGEPPMAIIEGSVLGMPADTRVGIRPERIMPAGPADPDCADLTATVTDTEFLGGQSRVMLAHPGARGLSIALPGHDIPERGSEIALHLPREHRVLFDAAESLTGEDPNSIAGRTSPNTRPAIAERHHTPT